MIVSRGQQSDDCSSATDTASLASFPPPYLTTIVEVLYQEPSASVSEQRALHGRVVPGV